MADRGQQLLAGGHLGQANVVVGAERAGGDESIAGWQEVQGVGERRGGQTADLLAIRNAPQRDATTCDAGGDALPIGGEGGNGKGAVAAERVQLLAQLESIQIPETDSLVWVAGGGPLAVGREGDHADKHGSIRLGRAEVDGLLLLLADNGVPEMKLPILGP